MRVRQKQIIDRFLGYFLIAVLLPWTRLLGIVLSRDHSTTTPPRRLLFIKLMGLGSLIVASDSIAVMRQRYPRTRFILLADPTIAAAIRPFGIFDEIHVVKTDRLSLTWFAMTRFFLRTWTWRRLWVVDLEVYSKLTTVLALLTLARNRFGFYLPPVPFRKYLNTHNVPFDQQAFLGTNYFVMAREVLGAFPEMTGSARSQTGDPLPQLPASPRRASDAAKPFIALNNTCSGLAYVRRLPDSVFSDVCQWILEHTAYRVALLGGPDDRAGIDRFIGEVPILQRQKDRLLNIAGAPGGFEAYYDFLRESCAFLVSIDSGPLHIARKLGLPTVSVWGPTDPAHYLPPAPEEKDRHLFFYSGVSCSPCIHRYSKLPCGGNNVCMKDIPSTFIIEKIMVMLGRLSSSGGYELSQRKEPGSPVLI